MCHPYQGMYDNSVYDGLKIFLVIWFVFMPILVLTRLERIIKLLEEKK